MKNNKIKDLSSLFYIRRQLKNIFGQLPDYTNYYKDSVTFKYYPSIDNTITHLEKIKRLQILLKDLRVENYKIKDKTFDCILINIPNNWFINYESSKHIFTITGISSKGRELDRCFGFCHTFDEASLEVVNNSCDMNESGGYEYIVIEEVEPGPYGRVHQEWWYRFEPSTDQYLTCGKPQEFKQICNFGIG